MLGKVWPSGPNIIHFFHPFTELCLNLVIFVMLLQHDDAKLYDEVYFDKLHAQGR